LVSSSKVKVYCLLSAYFFKRLSEIFPPLAVATNHGYKVDLSVNGLLMWRLEYLLTPLVDIALASFK
jgi:uncharacterized membrane protein YqaE (UPF0057 family)